MAFCWRSSVAPRRTSYQLHGPGQRNYGNHSVSSRQFNKGSDNRIRRRNSKFTQLTGTTGTITGTALTATCDSGTATVTGAVVGHTVGVSTTDGTDVGGAFYLRASVTSDEYDNGFRVRYRHTTQQSIHGNDLLASSGRFRAAFLLETIHMKFKLFLRPWRCLLRLRSHRSRRPSLPPPGAPGLMHDGPVAYMAGQQEPSIPARAALPLLLAVRARSMRSVATRPARRLAGRRLSFR